MSIRSVAVDRCFAYARVRRNREARTLIRVTFDEMQNVGCRVSASGVRRQMFRCTAATRDPLRSKPHARNRARSSKVLISRARRPPVRSRFVPYPSRRPIPRRRARRPFPPPCSTRDLRAGITRTNANGNGRLRRRFPACAEYGR